MADTAAAPVLPDVHLVLYTDGGARPVNPGFAGWGMHGYQYTKTAPKKGTGNAVYTLTERGYEESRVTDKIHAVSVISYLDGFGSFFEMETNNAAELEGATQALLFASEQGVKSVLIYSDSTYVVKGTNEWMHGWVKNQWMKEAGVPIKNAARWQKYYALYQELKARGMIMRFEWIRSHNDHVGNVIADEAATLGVMHSMARIVKTELRTSSPEGYWKNDIDRHPFMAHPYLSCNTQTGAHIPGEYYQGTVGKDIEHHGRRMRDGAFSVIQLAEPESIPEQMIKFYEALRSGQNSVVLMNLNNLYRGRTFAQITDHGGLATTDTKGYQLDRLSLSGEPIAHTMAVPLLAYRAAENISDLKDVLTQFQNEEKGLVPKVLVRTELTDILYEATIKTGKKGVAQAKQVFRSELYPVGFAKLQLQANFRRFETETIEAIDLALVMGIDILDRNALKRLEGLSPKVTLVSWTESEITFRFATIIQAGEDWGIWAGVYTNQRVIPVAGPAK